MRFLIYLLLFLIISFSLFGEVPPHRMVNGYAVLSREHAVDWVLSRNDYMSPKDYPELNKKIDRITNELYQGFIDKFEEFSHDTPRPLVLISKYFASNKLKIFYGHKSSNVIILNYDSTIKGDKDGAIYGVLAHEMAHYFLRHAETYELETDISSVFSIEDDDPDCAVCSTDTKGDSSLKYQLISLIKDLKVAGPEEIPELLNIPFSLFARSDLQNILLLAFNRGKCSSTEYHVLSHNLYINYFDPLKQRVRIPEEMKPAIEKQVSDFIMKARECLAKSDITLNEVVKIAKNAGFINKDSSKLERKISELNVSDENIMDALIKLTKSYWNDIKLKQENTNFSNVRYIGEEDEADIYAMKVLDHINKHQTGLEEFLYKDEKLKGEEGICREIVQKGQEPSYGPFTTSHHATCWRIYRLKRLREHLAEGKR